VNRKTIENILDTIIDTKVVDFKDDLRHYGKYGLAQNAGRESA